MMRIKIKLHNSEVLTVHLEQGRRYLFGRRKDCDVVLENHDGVSRTHFCIDTSVEPYRVEVFEGARPLKVKDQEIMNHDLSDPCALSLDPYTFVVEPSDRPIDSQTILEQPELEAHFDDITQIQSDGELVPYIIFKSGPKEQSLKLLGAHWVAGRDPSSDILIDRPRASRQHFELFNKNGRFFVRDLGSAHGTYVSGVQVSKTTPHELRSGDLIEVEGCHILFELRDPKFEEKAKEISKHISPLNLGGMGSWLPSVFQKQGIPEDSVVVFEETNTEAWLRKHKKQVATALMVLVVFYIFASGPSDEEAKRSPATEQNISDFDKLTPEQQNMVEYSFRLADNLIKQQKFELALTQLETVHNLVSRYNNSRELETLALQYREIRDQQNYLERQRRQQAEVNQKVRETMDRCRPIAEKATTLAEIEICLQPARILNPGHPEHQKYIDMVQARIADREKVEAERRRRQSRIASGASLFRSAKQLEERGVLIEAIAAYERHINSTYPDPDQLKSQSRKAVADLKARLDSEKEALMTEARDLVSSGEISRGLASAEKAKDYAPGDAEIQDFIDENLRQLNRTLKSLYTESVLEERFGNIEAAKGKWESILKMDIPGGEYQGRAQNKLKQYGGR